jgi:hypothetical protein
MSSRVCRSFPLSAERVHDVPASAQGIRGQDPRGGTIREGCEMADPTEATPRVRPGVMANVRRARLAAPVPMDPSRRVSGSESGQADRAG